MTHSHAYSVLRGIRARLRKGAAESRLVQDKRGATAVEFAIIGPVFLAMLLSLLEMGLLYTRLTMLDHAVGVVSKSVYTGVVSSGVSGGTVTQDDIIKTVCDNGAYVVFDCENNITVEMTEIASLNDIPTTDATCTDSSLTVKPTVTFDPGSTNSVVFVRVCAAVDVLTPGLGLGLSLSKTDNNKFELVSSTAFMNEPF